MNTRQELLSVIEQLPDEQLSSLLEVAQSLSEKNYALDRRAFLKLPADERDRPLAKQLETAAEHFRPGSEAMEWVEDYVEDENWDDE